MCRSIGVVLCGVVTCVAWAEVTANTTTSATTSATSGVHTQVQTTLGRQVVLRSDAPSLSPAQSPRALYVLHCAGCHGQDGSGSFSARVPDVRAVGHFLRVPGGREFLIQVPGVMASGLDDAQVAAVSNWLLTQLAAASLPPQHRPYDAAEIARLRQQPLVDVAATRSALAQHAAQLGWPVAVAP